MSQLKQTCNAFRIELSELSAIFVVSHQIEQNYAVQFQITM